MIGWVEAADILERGGHITHSTDGFDVPERRRIETWARDNRVTLESFIAFINTSSYWDDVRRSSLWSGRRRGMALLSTRTGCDLTLCSVM